MAKTTFSGPVNSTAGFEVDGVAISATPAEINAVADGSGSYVKVTDAATYTVLAANSGKLHILPNLTASCTLTLPAAADGLRYTFVYGGVAADAQNAIIDTGSDTNYFVGGLAFLDHDSTDAEVAPVFPDGNSNSIMTIVTPSAGTRVSVLCDGTLWYITEGMVVSASTPTFADQS